MLIFTMQKTMVNGLTNRICGFCGGEGYAPQILYAQAEGRFLRLFSKPGDGNPHERRGKRPGCGVYRGFRLAPGRLAVDGECRKAEVSRLEATKRAFLAVVVRKLKFPNNSNGKQYEKQSCSVQQHEIQKRTS
jgi:hypothetical protein